MVKKDLYLQSDKTYKPLNTLDWGVECLNKKYDRRVIIRLENDINHIVDLVERGWRMTPGKDYWLLRSAEVSLYDLSEVHKNPSTNPLEIYAYYLFLRDNDLNLVINKALKLNMIKNFNFLKLESDSYFESCVRIAGSDKRVEQVPNMILEMLKKDSSWKKYLKKASLILKPRVFQIKEKSFDRCGRKTKTLFEDIALKYRILGTNIARPKDRIYTGFWKKFPSFYNYFFIPLEGISFMCGYVEETGILNGLSLWERHITLHKNKEIVWQNIIASEKNNIAVADVVYSGHTLLYVKNQIIKDLGINESRVIAIGLFPKSRLCLSKLEYGVFLDQVVKIKGIDCKKENFFENTFINIVNNKSIKNI